MVNNQLTIIYFASKPDQIHIKHDMNMGRVDNDITDDGIAVPIRPYVKQYF